MTGAVLRRSPHTALVLVVRLPDPLEALRVTRAVTVVDLITERDGRWASRHRFPLRRAEAG